MPLLEIILIFTALLFFLFSGMRVAFALGITAFLLLLLADPGKIRGFALLMWGVSSSYVLCAIPLFILMAELFSQAGMADRTYNALTPLVGRIKGGLLHSNIVSCAFFAAISGSSVATAATITTTAYPQLLKRNYDPKIVVGSLAAGGTLGILIPPSINLLIYGDIVGESVGKLFIAGFLPGILLAALFMGYLVFLGYKYPEKIPLGEKLPWKTRLTGLKNVIPVIVCMVLLLVGLYKGFATPTELAALGVLIAFITGLYYRSFTFKKVEGALFSTLKTTCMILFILIAGALLSNALAAVGLIKQISVWVLGLGVSKWSLLFAIYIFYIILGCLLDGISMMVLSLPVVHPILTGAGFDSIWFGVILVILTEIGLITPPVGINLYVLQGVTGRDLWYVSQGALPFVAIMIICLLIITISPEIALWLPRQMK